MKIGVFLGFDRLEPQKGGEHSFILAMLDALSAMQNTRHEICVFYSDVLLSDVLKKKLVSSCTLIAVNKSYSWLGSFFQQKRNGLQEDLFRMLVYQHNIELLWYVIPWFIPVNVPYVYTVWDVGHRVLPFFPELSTRGFTFDQRESLYQKAIPKASFVITGNNQGKKEIMQFYGLNEERIRIIPFPVPNFATEENCQNVDIVVQSILKKRYLFYPAQFWAHKNHIVILLAVKILREQYNLDFDIVFTGSDKGNLSYIKEKTGDLRLLQNVHFLGFVSLGLLKILYKNAFALVYASFLGPNNIPPLEAFALSCPVIAANIPGAFEQFGDAALLFDPKDEFDLAEKIKLFCDDEDLRTCLKLRGCALSKVLTTQRYLDKVVEIFDDFVPMRRCWLR